MKLKFATPSPQISFSKIIFPKIIFLRQFLAKLIVPLFILLFCFEAVAEVKILEWNESSTLTDYGRKTKYNLKIQAINLPPNSGVNSFSLTSSANKKTEITKIMVNSMMVKFLNQPNSLEIFFSKPILNNQSVYIEYEVKDFYEKINKYLRQEQFYIPAFASGATVNIDFDLGQNYELISSHKNLAFKNNKVQYSGKVPVDGIKEVLKLTNHQSIWSVNIKSTISFNSTEGTAEITAPYLFRGGAQRVENQTIEANLAPKKHITTRGNDILTFDINRTVQEIKLYNKAIIFTGKNYKLDANNKNPQNYLEVSPNEEILLRPILQKIIYDPQYDFMPLHAKIVNFVNNYIKYDLSYYGKLLGVEDILKVKAGVCSEYATLFNALARVAKIPSSIVHGYALGENNKFESHAWNMIFVDNQWIYVDPTWNLSTGNVSSSHIYTKDNRKEEIIVKFQGKETEIKINRDFEIKEATN